MHTLAKLPHSVPSTNTKTYAAGLDTRGSSARRSISHPYQICYIPPMSSARVVATGVLAAVSAVAACGNGRTSDKELGSLVIKPDDTIKPIDLAKAVKDPGELGRAVALPHREVERLLGPHVTTFRS